MEMMNANADHGFPYIYSLSSHHLHSALQLTSSKIKENKMTMMMNAND